jgi:hypothetical protein
VWLALGALLAFFISLLIYYLESYWTGTFVSFSYCEQCLQIP